MQKNLRLFQVGGAILLSLFLVGVAAGTGGFSLAVAAESSVLSEALAAEAGKKEQEKDKKKKCDPGLPCQKHTPPVGGDVATDGTACTSGYACNSPNGQQPCGYMDAGHCFNIPQGGGKCACSCVMP